jgi:hypothetical protein
MPLKHAAGVGQHCLPAPQTPCRLVQQVYLGRDLVLRGQGLVGLDGIPGLDRAGEHRLAPLEGQPLVRDFSREGGGLHRRARAFGDGQSPWPSPVSARRQMIAHVELCASSLAHKRRPRQAIAHPPAASPREPRRSASHPLTGATTASVSGKGVRRTPAVATEKPRSASQ